MNLIKLASKSSKLRTFNVKRLSPFGFNRLFSTGMSNREILNYEPGKDINEAKKSILEKTKASYNAMSTGETPEYTKEGFKLNRRQAYDNFIDRMFEIYREENKFLQNLVDSTNYNLALKEIHRYDRMVDAKRAKGHTANAFHDYTLNELFESSTFVSSIEELEHNLLPGNFMTPHSISENLDNLAQLGYKRTSLVRKIREKLVCILQNKDEKPEKEFDILDPIYGDKTGRMARYNLYSGFRDSKEFYSHVETLLNWKTEEESFAQAREEVEAIEGEDRKAFQEILSLMKNIIEAGKEIKSIQAEFAEAIEEVRSQYSQLASAYDQTDFLQHNKYLKYDLLELQEKLVEAGIMNPDEATGISAYEKMPLDEKMSRAKELFYDLTKDYYPEMIPITDHLLDPVNNTPIRENISLLEKERQNEVSLKYIGLICGRLAEMHQSILRDDVPINDYFTEKCYGKEFLSDPLAKKKDPQVEAMNKYYTMFWKEVTETFNLLLPEVRRILSSNEAVPLNHMLCLCFGIYGGEVPDPEINWKIEGKVSQAIEEPIAEYSVDDLIIGTQGLANSLITYETQEKAFDAIKDQINQIDIHELNLNKKLRLAWGLTVLERFDSPILQELVNDFRTMPFENVQNELTYDEFRMLRDIFYGLEHLNTNENLKMNNFDIKVLVSNSQDLLKQYPQEVKKLDPFRKKIFDGLSMHLQ